MYAWDIPLYSPTMAGRLVGLQPERVRRWIQGYRYAYSVKSKKEIQLGQKKPVVSRKDKGEKYASFLELIDLLLVKEFLNIGFSLQKIRKALSETEEIIGERHFAKRCFFTDEKSIYLKVKDNADALLQLLSGGQWAIPEIIQQTAKRIVFDDKTDFAKKWYPLEGNGLVVLDPRISFGAPTIVGRGIPTANVYDLYVAENEEINCVCSWMELNRMEAESAIQFEHRLAA